MIRFIIGLFLIMGSVDVDHYELSHIVSISIGLLLVTWAGHSFRQRDISEYNRVIRGSKIRRRF